MGRTRDIGGMVMSAIFILAGVAALWDTTRMLDRDSYVYPRAVAVLMIIFCLVYIGRQLILPPKQLTESLEAEATQRGGSAMRRIGLVATLFGCAFIMPYVGFLISGAAAFAVMMLVAMYDPWNRFRVVVYPVVAAALVLGFYFMFKSAFLVPLPEATLF